MTRHTLMALVASTFLMGCNGVGPGEIEDGASDREANSLVSKKLGEACTLDIQCEESQDRADFLWSMGGGPRVLDADVVCRPSSQAVGAPEPQCQKIGDIGDACFFDSDCLDGLTCEGVVNKLFSDWSDSAGACTLAV